MNLRILIAILAAINAGANLSMRDWSEVVAWLLVVSYAMESAVRKEAR